MFLGLNLSSRVKSKDMRMRRKRQKRDILEFPHLSGGKTHNESFNYYQVHIF